MAEKIFLSSEQLHNDSIRLAAEILKSGFKPSVIIALWRGGTPIGIAIQEYIEHFGGIKTDHIAIRTSSYSGINQQSRVVKIHDLDYLIKTINNDDLLLIVDDVFDTGYTIKALIKRLKEQCRSNTPTDIRVAVPWYKPSKNQTDIIPNYYLHETEKWLKFPYSLEGLSEQEIRENRPEIYNIIKSALK